MKKKRYETETLEAVERRLESAVSGHLALGDSFCRKMIDGVVDLMGFERPDSQNVLLMKLDGLTDEMISEHVGTSRQAVTKKIARFTKAVEEYRRRIENEDDEGTGGEV